MPRQLISLATRPVDVLKGVGPKKVDALAELDITNVLELVTHYPRRYLDRTNQVDISELVVGEEAMVLAVVKRVAARRTRTGKTMVEVDVFDGSSYLKCTFFNQGWRAKQLSVGTEAVYFGKVDWFRGRRQMLCRISDGSGFLTLRFFYFTASPVFSAPSLTPWPTSFTPFLIPCPVFLATWPVSLAASLVASAVLSAALSTPCPVFLATFLVP